MEKLGYQMKSLFSKINAFFHSTEFLRVYDKIAKFIRNVVPKIAIYFTLIAFCYVFVYPLLRVLVDSFKVEKDIVNPDVVWIPTALTLNNYKNAMKALHVFKRWSSLYNVWQSTLLNSVLFSLISAIIETTVSCFAGYAFARFSFKGKKIWFVGLIFAFVVPTSILTLPRSMLLQTLRNKCSSASSLLGIKFASEAAQMQFDSALSVLTTLPAILLTLLGQGINSSILIFIFFSFFKMIPLSLDEAGQIDGANFFQIFYHIIIKMSVPTILVVFLFSFIWNWNDTYVLSKLSTLPKDSIRFKSLPQALDDFNYVMSQDQSYSGITENVKNNEGLKSAGIIFSILPLLILYAFTQRKFVEGIENTGVTGV